MLSSPAHRNHRNDDNLQRHSANLKEKSHVIPAPQPMIVVQSNPRGQIEEIDSEIIQCQSSSVIHEDPKQEDGPLEWIFSEADLMEIENRVSLLKRLRNSSHEHEDEEILMCSTPNPNPICLLSSSVKRRKKNLNFNIGRQ